MSKPILYASTSCQPCLETVDWLNSRGVEYTLKWVIPAMDLQANKFYRAVDTDVEIRWLRGVPTLIADGKAYEGLGDIQAHIGQHNPTA